MWYNQPCGEHFSGYRKRTYFSYLDSDGFIKVRAYDDFTKKYSQKIIYKQRYLDDHGAPVIHIIKKGKYKGHIAILISLHNSPLYLMLSKQPESITSFTKPILIDDGNCTYPSIIEDTRGDLMIFYKKNIPYAKDKWTRALYTKISVDGGHSWSRGKELVNMGVDTWVYSAVPIVKGRTVHLAFSVKQPFMDSVKNVYYIKSDDFGKSWKNNFRKKINLPIRKMTPIYYSPVKLETRVWDIKANNRGDVFMGFMNYDNNKGEIFWGKYNSANKWGYKPIALSTNSYYPSGLAIDYFNPYVVYCSENISGVNRITKRKFNFQRGSFEYVETISEPSAYNQVRPQVIENYSDIKLVWLEVNSYKDFMNYNTRIKAALK